MDITRRSTLNEMVKPEQYLHFLLELHNRKFCCQNCESTTCIRQFCTKRDTNRRCSKGSNTNKIGALAELKNKYSGSNRRTNNPGNIAGHGVLQNMVARISF